MLISFPKSACHTYQMRAYLYEARGLYSSDNSGLSSTLTVSLSLHCHHVKLVYVYISTYILYIDYSTVQYIDLCTMCLIPAPFPTTHTLTVELMPYSHSPPPFSHFTNIASTYFTHCHCSSSTSFSTLYSLHLLPLTLQYYL